MSTVDINANPAITVGGTPVKGLCFPDIKNIEFSIYVIFLKVLAILIQSCGWKIGYLLF